MSYLLELFVSLSKNILKRHLSILMPCAILLTVCNTTNSNRLPAPAEIVMHPFEAVVVGTIHKSHLIEPSYTLSVLAELIESYKPDLVLVEIRPEPFRRGHYEDGPFEMTYVTWLSRNMGISVAPIDWFRDKDIGRTIEPDPFEKNALDKEINAAQTRIEGPIGFEIVHSKQRKAAQLSILNIQARYLGGNAIWSQRQAWFNHQSIEAIRNRGSRRVMAFLGTIHSVELEAYLWGQGASIRNPPSIPLTKLEKAEVPEPVIQLWREGIVRMKTEAGRSTGKKAKALINKANYFQIAVDRRGRCCAEQAAFDALEVK
ncbi:MAG: hypothetical protein HQK54_10440 [Oligoflexales bacterium]|nr:hypothetical protein [Oligoflexales bacterium]